MKKAKQEEDSFQDNRKNVIQHDNEKCPKAHLEKIMIFKTMRIRLQD